VILPATTGRMPLPRKNVIIICLLSVYKPGILPILEELLNGIESNSDGSGFCIATKTGQLIVEHAIGITTTTTSVYKDKAGNERTAYRTVIDTEPLEALARRFVKLRARHPEGPASFHSRFATGGTEDLRGCHPYRVGGSGQTMLAHNGVLFPVPMGDWRSDTRIFAEDILPVKFNKFWKPAVKAAIEKHIGFGNKLAIITVDKRQMTRKRGMLSNEPFELFMFNEKAGSYTKEGAWHSNTAYKGYSRNYTYSPKDYDYTYGSTAQKEGGTYSTGWSGHDTGGAWGGYQKQADGSWDWKAEPTSDSPEGTCTICGAFSAVNLVTNVCEVCDSCQDCYGVADADCDCYTPGKATVPANTRLAITAGDDEDELTWPEYLAKRDAGRNISFKSPDAYEAEETTKAWEIEQAAMAEYAADNDRDDAWMASLIDEYVTDKRPTEGDLTAAEEVELQRQKERAMDRWDDSDEPGIIRRLR
jgi:hypothetical protein